MVKGSFSQRGSHPWMSHTDPVSLKAEPARAAAFRRPVPRVSSPALPQHILCCSPPPRHMPPLPEAERRHLEEAFRVCAGGSSAVTLEGLGRTTAVQGGPRQTMCCVTASLPK